MNGRPVRAVQDQLSDKIGCSFLLKLKIDILREIKVKPSLTSPCLGQVILNI